MQACTSVGRAQGSCEHLSKVKRVFAVLFFNLHFCKAHGGGRVRTRRWTGLRVADLFRRSELRPVLNHE